MLDTVVADLFDAYSEEEIADLSTGLLVELKRLVNAEVRRRVESYSAAVEAEE